MGDALVRLYGDPSITKWNIFHYIYAVLHHPGYRERYTDNLRPELPPSPSTCRPLALVIPNEGGIPTRPEHRVTKMRLSKDKTSLVYNQFLTLSEIPKETYDYRLGNRSALEWVIDQYQVSTDRRSGITNDLNRADDPQYILRLIGQVITVSVETVKIVGSLPSLGLEN